MRRTVLLLLLAAAAAWAFFAWRAARGPAARAPVLSDGDVEITPSPARHGPPAMQRSTAELPAPASDGRPLDTRPIEERGTEKADDPLLAAQYAGWSREKLEEQLMALELDYAKELDAACEARFAARQYRVLDSGELEGVDPSYDVLSAYDQEGVLTRVRTVALPEVPATEPGKPPELEVEHQLVSLPPENYPDLYRRRTELAWLRAKLAAEKTEEDPH